MDCTLCCEPVGIRFSFHEKDLYCEICFQSIAQVIETHGQDTFGLMVFQRNELYKNPTTENAAAKAERILEQQSCTDVSVQWVSDDLGPYINVFCDYTDPHGEKQQRLMPLLAQRA